MEAFNDISELLEIALLNAQEMYLEALFKINDSWKILASELR